MWIPLISTQKNFLLHVNTLQIQNANDFRFIFIPAWRITTWNWNLDWTINTRRDSTISSIFVIHFIFMLLISYLSFNRSTTLIWRRSWGLTGDNGKPTHRQFSSHHPNHCCRPPRTTRLPPARLPTPIPMVAVMTILIITRSQTFRTMKTLIRSMTTFVESNLLRHTCPREEPQSWRSTKTRPSSLS